MNKYAQHQILKQTPLAATIASILAVSSAHAATITVNTIADPGDASDCSLRSAVQAANTDSMVDGCDAGSGADEIVFDSSLAFSTITPGAGEIEITGPLTITGRVSNDPNGLIIDAASASRIFNIQGSEPNDFEVRLNSLTLAKGYTVDSFEHGGAIRANQADLHLDHVVVRDSSTAGEEAYGGGLSVRYGDVTLTNSMVFGNSTAGEWAYGGGMFVRGNIELTNSMVYENSTVGGGSFGGGLHIRNGNAALTNTTVSGNSTVAFFSSGGGVYARDGDLTLTGSTVSGNSTVGSFSSGGGVYAWNGDLTLTASTVSGNSTESGNCHGGGLYVYAGDVALTNSTVSGNSVNYANGGGLYVRHGNVELTHATVADNMAGDGTDGVHLGDGSPSLTRGNGEATLILNNSLIAQSGAGETACNVIASHANSLATDASCGVPVATLAAIALAPLADNGGPTLTHALNADSVAINAAGNCGDDFEITTDQRGQPRPGADSIACDIGAFEFQIQPDAIFADRFQTQPEPLIGQM